MYGAQCTHANAFALDSFRSFRSFDSFFYLCFGCALVWHVVPVTNKNDPQYDEFSIALQTNRPTLCHCIVSCLQASSKFYRLLRCFKVKNGQMKTFVMSIETQRKTTKNDKLIKSMLVLILLLVQQTVFVLLILWRCMNQRVKPNDTTRFPQR